MRPNSSLGGDLLFPPATRWYWFLAGWPLLIIAVFSSLDALSNTHAIPGWENLLVACLWVVGLALGAILIAVFPLALRRQRASGVRGAGQLWIAFSCLCLSVAFQLVVVLFASQTHY